MPTDFEQRLRDGLHARAEQIEPDPATWRRVQEGIERRRRFRWVLAATATAAIAAAAVLIVPGVLTGADIGFDPDIATQPEGDGMEGEDGADPAPPIPDVVPPPVDVVISAEEVGIIGPGVSQSLGMVDDPGRVAVHPASTTEAIDAVIAGGCELHRLVGGLGGASVEQITEDGGPCAAGPRFSPDGRHLVWVEADDEGFGLGSVGWDGGPNPVRNATWELDLSRLEELGVAGLDSLQIIDWIPGEEGGGQGTLFLSGSDADGATNRVFRLPLAQEPDGGLALPGGVALEPDDDGGDRRMLGYQRTDAAAWSLELLSTGVVEVIRSDEGEELGALPLPQDVLDAATVDSGPVWLEVVDEVAVFGDGVGRAWWAEWDGQAWTEITELAPGLEVVHAAPLGGGAPTGEPSQTDDATEEEPPGESEPDDGEPADGEQPGLPAEVQRTRAALMAAAESGDLENLRPLIPDDGFTFSFGAGPAEDPIAYWQARQAEGEDVLGTLLALLELPPTDGSTGIVVWPYAYDRTYESLSSAELIQLEEALGGEAMEFYAEANDYLLARVGIDADGTWRFYVAGD